MANRTETREADHGDTVEADADFKFLFTNTFLFDGVAGIGEAPDQASRAEGLGERVRSEDFDVAAFCEVFDPVDRERILEPMEEEVTSVIGPKQNFLQIGSGLQTVIRNLDRNSVVAHDVHQYDHGSSWTKKSVLFLQIDLGDDVGQIDLFSTHTYINPDIIPEAVKDTLLGEKGASYYRREQLDELTDFIDRMKKQHDAERNNPTIVCGDFNLKAHSDEYENVETMMDEANLYDAWVRHRSGYGATWKAREGSEYQGGGMYPICKFDPTADDPYYCTVTDVEDGMRLDYIFIEEERDTHDVSLDVKALRRRPWYRYSETSSGDPDTGFWRDKEKGTTNYLSDHMGLELQFDLTPK
jgi:hypothetical protein